MYKNKKIILIVLITLSFFGLFFYTSKITPKEEIISKSIGKTYGVNTILDIDGTRFEREIKDLTSVYDFIDQFRQEGKINFTEKNYLGMGKFIDSINGIKNSSGQSWIYYVNNQKASVGVSSYQLKSGDVVSWKYEKNY